MDQWLMYFALEAWAMAILLGLTLGSLLFMIEIKCVQHVACQRRPLKAWMTLIVWPLLLEGVFRLGVIIVFSEQSFVWSLLLGMMLWLVWELLTKGKKAWWYALLVAGCLLSITWFTGQIYTAVVTHMVLNALNTRQHKRKEAIVV